MCRNIRTLHNYEPPATEEEVRAAALQFVRKISGYTRPPKVNADAFHGAVEDIARITSALLEQLEATSAPKNREVEAEKARQRWRDREARRA